MSLKSWSKAAIVTWTAWALGCGGGSGDNGQTDLNIQPDASDLGVEDDGGPPPECASDDDCKDKFNDLGQCETFFCDMDAGGGTCAKKAVADGTVCDDGDSCTQGDQCAQGKCTAGKECECRSDNDCKDKFNDLDQCEMFFCDFETGGGTCDRKPKDDGTECDDGDPCTQGDQCAAGLCESGATQVCECMIDDDCAQFEDGDLCNGTLVCDLKHFPYKCVLDPETVVECDDSGDSFCQENQCVPATGACEMTPVKEGENCEDGDVCTVVSTCQEGICGPFEMLDCDDGEVCTTDSCDSKLGCIHTPNTLDCDDMDACTQGDKCANGACMSGTPVECDNGVFCDGAETCDPASGCVSGPPPDCDDASVCTADSCDAAQDMCVHQMLDTAKEGPLGSNSCLDQVDNDCDGATDADDPECSFGITGVSPEEGPSSGGTTVTLTGGGFDLLVSVVFGGEVVPFTIESADTVTLVAPPHEVGDVSITLSDGWIEFTLADAFRYTGKAFDSGLTAVFHQPAIYTMSEGDTLAGVTAGVEVASGPADPAGIIAQVGFGPKDSLPWENPDWTWVDMSDISTVGSTIEYQGDLTVELGGYFNMAARFSADGGYTFEYGDLDGSDNGYDPAGAALLTVWGRPDPGDIVINELMWMGSNANTYDEWFELRNMTRAPYNLSGFKMTNAGTIGADFWFEAAPHTVNNLLIEPFGYFLVAEKSVDDSFLAVQPDIVGNNTMVLPNGVQVTYKLVSADGTVVDQAMYDGTIGYNGDANLGKPDKSMERNENPGDGMQAANWHTAWVHEGWDGDPLQKVNWGTPRGPNSDIPTCSQDSDCADSYPDQVLGKCEKRVCAGPAWRCTFAQREEGEACDDGFAFTDSDVCLAGDCRGVVSIDPTVFRIDSLDLVAPILTYDFGSGPVEVNDLLSSYLTIKLDSFEFGGLVTAFDPLALEYPYASMMAGEGQCAKDQGVWQPCCTLAPLGKQAGFDDVTFMESGDCLSDPEVAAPCFKTGTTSFNLADIIPDVFPADVGEVTGFGAGTFTGDPITGLTSGVIKGFLPQTAVADLSFDLGGTVVSGADLLGSAQIEIVDGVPGYWVDIRFTAGRTDCDDGNPCTIDQCSPTTGACQYSTAPDGTACDDGFDYTTDDMCSVGVCKGQTTVAPTVFRIDSLSLETPSVMYDFGSGPVAVNNLISAFMTAKLDQFESGGLVTAFDPLALEYPYASMLVGEGQCPKAAGQWVPCCTMAPAGKQSQFENVTYKQTGNCSEDPLVAATCFITEASSFKLSDVIPDIFPEDVGSVVGFGAGTFTGDPINAIDDGFIQGFLPQASVADLSFNLGGTVVNGADLLADTPTQTKDGVVGWWVTLSYTAKRNCE
ncbi:MAG: hypothetical protein GXP54_00145 [Deltaproteobacteria bacterium]|nr:hypothetical protein [Deltaproteobacteria bacterium]